MRILFGAIALIFVITGVTAVLTMDSPIVGIILGAIGVSLHLMQRTEK